MRAPTTSREIGEMYLQVPPFTLLNSLEVDLGNEQAIDRIVVWNRTETMNFDFVSTISASEC